MPDPATSAFIFGAIVMACAACGMFFLRFWRTVHDRLFLIFAIAFWVLGLNWLALAFVAVRGHDEYRVLLYAIRALAFALILAGIIDKNRRSSVQLP